MQTSFLHDFKTETKLLVTLLGILAILLTIGVFIYISSVQAITVTSQKSGNWSNPATWSTGTVPGATDTVTIAAGHTVTYDVLSNSVLGRVDIHGTLYFSRTTNTRLKTNDNIVVQSGGNLNMGTSQDFIPQSVKAEVIWQLTQTQANAYVPVVAHHVVDADKGLWALGGSKWNVHGQPLLKTWSKLAQTASAGATSLITEGDTSDWPVGGTVVFSQTSPVPAKADIRKYTPEEELHTIQSLTKLANGTTRITLTKPLQYTHEGVTPFQGEVGLLTRNILFTTQIIGVSEASFISDVRTRKFAHTAYMPTAQGNLEYAEFKFMGHYGNLGTYATHHHQSLESSRGMIVRGTSGWYNGFRCVNLHITHGVLVEDNVCYHSASTAFFAEDQNSLGFNSDNVFVHNLAVGTRGRDRNDKNLAGETNASGFWPGAVTVNEAFLGNVAAGFGGVSDSSGFRFFEGGNNPDTNGTIPFTFVKNEAHNDLRHGIWAWQNAVPDRDMVDFIAWRNGEHGIEWGAYNNPFRFYNSKFLENGEHGLNLTSVNTYLQDSLVRGRGSSTSSIGYHLNSYINAQYPGSPVKIIRNTFEDLGEGITQIIDTCPDLTFSEIKQRPVARLRCSSFYTEHTNNIFKNVGRNLFFGMLPNPNSWAKVFDYSGPEGLPKDFVMVRPDQLDPANQGMLIPQLITPQSFYSSAVDGVITPMSSLPSQIVYTGLPKERSGLPSPDFTFKTSVDYPPTVSLNTSVNGKIATMTANSADDKGVTRLEFFVDWINVATVNNPSPTETITVNLSQIPGDTLIPKRKFAYLYVRAFDGADPLVRPKASPYEQRAYSQVVVVGPEILGIPTSNTVSIPTAPSVPVITQAPPVITAFSPGTATSGQTSSSSFFPAFVNHAVQQGATQAFTVSAIDNDSDLQEILWLINGIPQKSTAVSGGSGSDSFQFTFANAGQTEVRVEAFDAQSQIDSVTWTITVASSVTAPVVSGSVISSVTAANGKRYEVDTATPGKLFYIDRTKGFGALVSPYEGLEYIRTANDDKLVTNNTFVTFTAKQNVIVYIAHDDRIIQKPSWLASFADTGDNMVINSSSHSVFKKDFAAGDIALGGNSGSNTSNMYVVFARANIGGGTAGTPVVAVKIGDLNRDGKVNILDVSILLSRWGKTDATSLQEADISTGFNNTSAGRIDIFDANRLMANWTG